MHICQAVTAVHRKLQCLLSQCPTVPQYWYQLSRQIFWWFKSWNGNIHRHTHAHTHTQHDPKSLFSFLFLFLRKGSRLKKGRWIQRCTHSWHYTYGSCQHEVLAAQLWNTETNIISAQWIQDWGRQKEKSTCQKSNHGCKEHSSIYIRLLLETQSDTYVCICSEQHEVT